MKRYILSLFVCLVTVFSIAQNTRWNSKTCVYSDFTNGFAWSFPVSDWEITSGGEKHTVFKIYESNTMITAFINIRPTTTNKDIPDDIFLIHEKLEKMENLLEKEVERVSGQKVTENTRKKTRFGGKNAIKRRYITEFVDDRYEEPLRVITFTYHFIYNNSIWAVTLKCDKDIYDLMLKQENYNIEDIFKGFRFIHAQ